MQGLGIISSVQDNAGKGQRWVASPYHAQQRQDMGLIAGWHCALMLKQIRTEKAQMPKGRVVAMSGSFLTRASPVIRRSADMPPKRCEAVQA